jgi:cytochrome c553
MRTQSAPDIMEVHARGYSDAQLQAIGNYFASLRSGTSTGTTTGTTTVSTSTGSSTGSNNTVTSGSDSRTHRERDDD